MGCRTVLDAEAVAREREDFLLEDQRLGLVRDVLVEYADCSGHGLELRGLGRMWCSHVENVSEGMDFFLVVMVDAV